MWHNKIIPEEIRDENSRFNEFWIKNNGLKGDGIVTKNNLDVSDELKADSSPFMVVWLKNIERLCDMLGRGFDFPSYELLDVGCGSGISTLYFKSKYPFRRYSGFDFSERLIEQANLNEKLFPSAEGDSGRVSFEVADARAVKLPSEPFVIFMFNPFGWDTMRVFLENNIESLRRRESIILYANDIHLVDLCSYGKLISRDSFYNLSVVRF